MLVCALGDLVLDVVVRLAATPAEGGDTPADILLGPGGQAANVAAWTAELGAKARLVCKSGTDDAGRLAREGLAARGVEVFGPVEGATGVVCALVARGRTAVDGDEPWSRGHPRPGGRRPGLARWAATTSSSRGTR